MCEDVEGFEERHGTEVEEGRIEVTNLECDAGPAETEKINEAFTMGTQYSHIITWKRYILGNKTGLANVGYPHTGASFSATRERRGMYERVVLRG